MRKDHWWVPLTGVLFVVVAIVGSIVSGEPPGADDPAAEIVSHYEENKDSIQIGAMIYIWAAALFVFFAGYMRRLLDDHAGGRSMLPAIALIGSAIFATGAAIDATAPDVEPTAVQALQALWDNDFMPFALGVSLFFLGIGLAVVRYGGLPKWLGWVAVALGAIALTPVGFVALMAGGLWTIGVGVLLALRGRRAGRAGAPPAAPAADRGAPAATAG
jgi:uncharacterized membrane protein YhaH (DUF805 family)